MSNYPIDRGYLQDTLVNLLNIPSPTGRTDEIVSYVCDELTQIGIRFELTRRGAIRAELKGEQESPDRAVVAHLDTLGAMVKFLKNNGRLETVPIGTWSSRFAEGARVTMFCDDDRQLRGTLLPKKSSGHTFNEEIDTQQISWENLEVRIDKLCNSKSELECLGINVGDFIALDPGAEIIENNFIVSRYLDDKAGVAAILSAAKSIQETGLTLPVDCHLLFTISEEVGVGASHVLHGDVAELVSVDNATVAEGQNSCESGVTIAMQDSSGPFDYHLTHKLIQLCGEHGIEHSRDVFKYYRSDAASAMEAGNDIRTALLGFGLDASHGYERVHFDSLEALAKLLILYIQSPPTFKSDKHLIAPPGK
ncbi:MAG: osmoprotectant NAGGN system M42 family peptidase [Candidatus Nitronauta litoralis]|uniref:Osmoprotectant NAGGN system M42 family peptidase n=1 Tax=Candidatus Nitronauta litoralis TaxID=2705533 RepID=A0A7T0BWF8_9BACT|nr:MAG: osmoprotectant NAGGN system M42 family peptidase [Candidatus Nitronauta litoralis]